jgi:acetyl/propionyl-CoA carboxylase alpha subunit
VKITKLLIANRGEIAVRVIRAAREMGISTVAIYSEADTHSMHTALADEAVCVGAPEPAASYLDMARVVKAAKDSGAQAIHPGYGFLSERAEFADLCEQEGLIFVGPPASAMRRLGAKIDAKQLAVEQGVPVTPGFFQTGATPEQLKDAADQIGYPVMLKASAGGGGRGMRIVREPNSFMDELNTASDEALKGFGDGAMMVEKLVEKPRHIEVQVLADQHGNVATLFERECSIQRRHQKLIEEAPSPVFAEQPDIWPRMREAAAKLIKASGYTNAGTVEFMVDEAAGEFYFLEVNARLQVEHPVTEAITGLDLVQWQLRIAQGETLDIDGVLLRGERAAIRGHAIEVRIVAEDPEKNFLPSIGKIVAWAEPHAPGVRVDTGFVPGSEVSRYYDSLLAKVIAHGSTRAQAMSRLKAALLDFHVIGVKTNISYLLAILDHSDFAAGRMDTGFLAREMADWGSDRRIPAELGAILGAPVAASAQLTDLSVSVDSTSWSVADGFRNAR